VRAASAGDTVGPYRLIKAIGAGGSARVDLACLDRAYGFQRRVVLKRPLEHLRGDARATAQLSREARICGRLAHPHLVGILDAGEHDGALYLALEYVPGGSLRSLVQNGRPPLPVALAIAVDVARGLHHAHELRADDGSPLGLVHRDVSPGNILIGADGAVKLADFGIAVETRVSTLSGSMHGTVAYMAPEQCRGHAFDRRADVFSLGVILYELVTGARLFASDNDVATLHRVLSAAVVPPHRLVPDLPLGLEDIILTAIAHEPERRFATAGELADALEVLAARASISLTARAIARWIAAGTPAAPSVAPVATPPADASLVDLIAAMPPDAPAPTFDLGAAPAPPPTSSSSPAPSRRRKRIALAGLAAGLAAGVAVLVLSRSPSTTATSASQPTSPTPPAPPAIDEPARMPAPLPVASVPEAPPPAPPAPPPKVEEPKKPIVRQPVPVRVRPPDTAVRTPDAQRTPDTPARTPDVSDVRPPDTVGQGSAPTATGRSTGTKAKVEWKPGLILPTDAGSGGSRR
jgi:serine/threonine protein kinase